MPPKPISIEEAFERLKIKDKSILAKMANAKTYEEACKTVEEMHEIVKKQKRKLSKKYHPDLGGDAEKFREMIELTDALFNLKVQIRRPQPVMTVIIRSTTYYDPTTTSNTSTTSTWWTSF